MNTVINDFIKGKTLLLKSKETSDNFSVSFFEDGTFSINRDECGLLPVVGYWELLNKYPWKDQPYQIRFIPLVGNPFIFGDNNNDSSYYQEIITSLRDAVFFLEFEKVIKADVKP